MAHIDLATVSARARGLRRHLLVRAELERLATLPDIPSVARELAKLHPRVQAVSVPATTSSIELAIRETQAAHLRTLALWTEPAVALDLFYAEQDRRTLRAMLRGAMNGAPPADRLSGLIPSPRLPERALTELARQPTPAKVALGLVLLQHPDARRLLPLASRAHPVLFDLEMALARGFAERTTDAARCGDRNLRAVVRQRIDVLNAQTALTLAGTFTEVTPRSLVLPGGAALSVEAFVDACGAASRAAAVKTLASALGRGPLLASIRAAAGDPVRLETEAFVRALEEQRRQARVDPLGSAPLLLFLMRLEAQARDLLRVVSSVSLGVPRSLVTRGLVTPWS